MSVIYFEILQNTKMNQWMDRRMDKYVIKPV